MKPELSHILERQVLVLDGAMGTMLQQLSFKESDYRGERFSDLPGKLLGCNDILCLTQPEAILKIHKSYLEAGADIISTNSFNANSISMQEYGLSALGGVIKEINCSAAKLARKAVEESPNRAWGGKAIVAGSVGPTNKTASMSPYVDDPAFRDINFDDLYSSYSDQIEGLIQGGVDLLLFETVFDTLNLKAGLNAANDVMNRLGVSLPIMISATISGKSGRTLSGQTLKGFVTSIEDYDNVVSLGLNCSFGPKDIIPYLRELSVSTRHYVSCHPNAGLPNELGEYDETPELFASYIKTILKDGLVNIIGGCCGTTPDHIKEIVKLLPESNRHERSHINPALRVSGLEMLEVSPENNFINIGERCNVAGSRKFLRLIKEKKFEECAEIALAQVEAGAMMIDVNMDDGLLDSKEEMTHFLRYISSEPAISKVPVMIDSSDWGVVEQALKNLQGKSIVNSISLKEGEETFIRKARRIRALGSALIVMAFDENGQADSYQRKIDICERAYRLLTEKCGFSPNDIIFDVNILAVATGLENDRRYAADFIEAVAWIKKNLPGTLTSGGISNLSFSFRGKNRLRDSMHVVFLYHAISAGLDMAIMNPAVSLSYNDVPVHLRELIEDVIFDRNADASEKLSEYASSEIDTNIPGTDPLNRDLSIPVAERLILSLMRGESGYLKEDILEAILQYNNPVEIIEGPLMEGMKIVGKLFGEGKMFLPQVVKTARTMKQAVGYLQPYLKSSETENSQYAGKALFATVKGDVHDIGKNICSIVLQCNNIEVIDLGVMVSSETIISTIKKESPDIVCLSGLIIPSLAEMTNVVKAMQAEGFSIPVIVGGATTTKLHTALKIAPCYNGIVAHASDASQNTVIALHLLDSDKRIKFGEKLKVEYQILIDKHSAKENRIISIDEARKRSLGNNRKRFSQAKPLCGLNRLFKYDVKLSDIKPYINWKLFFHAWRLSGNFIDRLSFDETSKCFCDVNSLTNADGKKFDEARSLYEDALNVLSKIDNYFDGKAMVEFFNASSRQDNILLADKELPLLRQQSENSEFLSLADFISNHDNEEDYIALFAVTSGKNLTKEIKARKDGGDEYGSLLLQSLSDRLAEATAEWLHHKVRAELWGYEKDDKMTIDEIMRGEYVGIRPAIGYPSLPDQLLTQEINKIMPLDEIGIKITENGAMIPSSSVSGFMIAHPDSHYFMIGEIGEDQLKDYSLRRGLPEERIREILRM